MRQPAVVREYHELLQALDARRRELGMPMIELDERAGLPLGYVGKLLTDPTKRNAKTLGRVSLGLVLKALDLRMEIVPTAARHGGQAQAQQGEEDSPVSTRMKIIGAKGGAAFVSRRTPEQLARHQRRAARLRWARVREEKRRQKAREARRLEQEAKEQRRAERAAQAAAEAALVAQQQPETTTCSPS